ncbi:MAG: hypothetical protein J0L62_13140 [Bacteroidetes bacterium]|nr:hypothetical protein [Bacteroidota bacterium]
MNRPVLPPRTGFALLLIAIGLFILLDKLEVYDFGDLVSTWWPLILIYIGSHQLITRGNNRSTGSYILIAVGLFFLFHTLDLFDYDLIQTWWPALLVLVGIWILIDAFSRKNITANTPDSITPVEGNEDMLNSSTFLSGSNIRSMSQNFTGGKITVVLGGAEIDLRQAKLVTGATIDIMVLLGGCELYVPYEWDIDIQAQAFLGGIEDKRLRNQVSSETPAPILRITGTAVLGGIEIK